MKKVQKIFSSGSSSPLPAPSDAPIALHLPEFSQQSPLLLSSPHSGRHYTEEFLKGVSLPLHELQRMEDRFVDQLLEETPSHGISVIQALFPRSFCDANRDWRELDAAMFSPPLLHDDLRRSPKVAAGYGVIPRCATPGRSIYRYCLSPDEAEHRLLTCWRPYHQALKDMQHAITERFGFSVLIDIHSMPPLAQARPCDIVLGDVHGHSCHPLLTEFLEEAFSRYGYAVQRNTPYAGGYITSNYSQKEKGLHTIQIEINRSCYINLNTLSKNKNFTHVKNDTTSILYEAMRWIQNDGQHILINI